MVPIAFSARVNAIKAPLINVSPTLSAANCNPDMAFDAMPSTSRPPAIAVKPLPIASH